jgi:hypothetical protein
MVRCAGRIIGLRPQRSMSGRGAESAALLDKPAVAESMTASCGVEAVRKPPGIVCISRIGSRSSRVCFVVPATCAIKVSRAS